MTKPKTGTAAMPKLYSTEAEFDKARKSITQRGQALQRDIHVLLLSSLAKLAKDGDIRRIVKDLDCMPDMTRKNAVKAWLEAFGPISFAGSEPAHVKDKRTNLDAANATPFWKFSPEPAYVPLDMLDWLGKTIKKLQKDQTETGADHAEMITFFEGQITKMKSAANTNNPPQQQLLKQTG